MVGNSGGVVQITKMIRNGRSRYLRIPHLDINELLDPGSIIIVHLDDESGQPDERSSPARKQRKTTEAGAKLVENSEYNDCEVIKEELQPELPSKEIDIPGFKEASLDITERLENLGWRSFELALCERMQRSPEMPTADASNLCHMRRVTHIQRLLKQTIRTPTITEVIYDAARSNLQRVIESKKGDPLSKRNKLLDISVNADTNAWSESNLYDSFATNIEWSSYKLAAGVKSYKHELLSHTADLNRTPLLHGPQNHSTPVLFHRNATKRYLEKHPGGARSLLPEGEVIITVTLFHGVRGHKLAEFDMLSHQTLADLKDAFQCPYEIHPVEQDLELKGSCFMLNGQLYPDYRNDACDYAIPLLHFLDKYKEGTLHTTECIEQTNASLCHMELSTYSPGFLLHHGDCEHRIMITGIRTYDEARDSPYEQCYPVSVFKPRERSMPCDICEYRSPTKVVFNSPLLPHIPSHLCDTCYSNFQAASQNAGIYKSDGLAATSVIKMD